MGSVILAVSIKGALDIWRYPIVIFPLSRIFLTVPIFETFSERELGTQSPVDVKLSSIAENVRAAFDWIE